MEYKEWEKQRTAALEALREFLKTLPEKGFTMRQLEMIGEETPKEVRKIMADIEERLVLTQDLTDLDGQIIGERILAESIKTEALSAE